MITLFNRLQDIIDSLKALDFLAPLALRFYLFAVFWVAGMNKVTGFDGVVDWFGNPDWGLGLPAPFLLALLATASEVVGAVFILFGFAVRWIAIPLMVTMVIAATTVHWDNGWQAVADPMSPYASEHLGPLAFEQEKAQDSVERKNRAVAILKRHGNYAYLTGNGSFAVSNNGIEWAVTYFVMLLGLFFLGAGRFFSVDYWIARKFRDR